jgi:hypothetical protein
MQGQGGQGRPGTGSGNDPDQHGGRTEDGTDPEHTNGDKLDTNGTNTGNDQGETVGKSNSTSGRGMATVPESLQDDLDRTDTATSHNHTSYSPAVEELISRFFDLLNS